jgi:hypothetical protein
MERRDFRVYYRSISWMDSIEDPVRVSFCCYYCDSYCWKTVIILEFYSSKDLDARRIIMRNDVDTELTSRCDDIMCIFIIIYYFY